MIKEKEILLNPEELERLLDGGLYWKDIENKILDETETRKQFKDEVTSEKARIKSDNLVKRETAASKERENDDGEVRSVLLGDDSLPKNQSEAKAISEEQFADSGQEEIRFNKNLNRQININYTASEDFILMEKKEESKIDEGKDKSLQNTPTESVDEGVDNNYFSEDKSEEAVSDLFNETDFVNSDFQSIINENSPQKASPLLSGLKLVILLIAVAAATFGFWYYYIGK